MCYVLVCLVNSIGEKVCLRIFGQNGPEINEKKLWTVALVLNMNRLSFMKFWDIILVFAQENGLKFNS